MRVCYIVCSWSVLLKTSQRPLPRMFYWQLSREFTQRGLLWICILEYSHWMHFWHLPANYLKTVHTGVFTLVEFAGTFLETTFPEVIKVMDILRAGSHCNYPMVIYRVGDLVTCIHPHTITPCLIICVIFLLHICIKSSNLWEF